MLGKLIASSLLLVSASASLAEIQSFTAENISGISHMLYLRLDVSGLTVLIFVSNQLRCREHQKNKIPSSASNLSYHMPIM